MKPGRKPRPAETGVGFSLTPTQPFAAMKNRFVRPRRNVLRGGERPAPLFWAFSGAGAAVVVGFALLRSGPPTLGGDVLMLAAIAVCGLGYAEGAVLTRRLGGWQSICWALLLAVPAMAVVAIVTVPDSLAGIGILAWSGLAYVSVFSMLVGFVFWFRGLARGGIAGVGQVQLLQPFLGLGLSALLLHEAVSWTMLAASSATLVCVAGAKRHVRRPGREIPAQDLAATTKVPA